jgi:hypothetical protein
LIEEKVCNAKLALFVLKAAINGVPEFVHKAIIAFALANWLSMAETAFKEDALLLNVKEISL